MGERGHTVHVLHAKPSALQDCAKELGVRLAVLARDERWTSLALRL